MSIDDTVLLAYVDGDLPSERRAEVEAAAAHSQDLAARLAAMRASVLPYGAAFDRQVLPPVPQQLAKRVAELASVSSNSYGESRRRSSALWLAAAFVAGVLCSGAALQPWLTGSPGFMSSAAASPWIKAVADYQSLYSRQTLADISEDHTLTEKILGDVRAIDGMAVQIPDLRDAGLTFKRVQRLTFHNQPVVQIVYLPAQGDPIALCVTHDGRTDETPRAQQLGEMKTIIWRHDRLGYVLLGKSPGIDLTELARRIAHSDTGALYSHVDTGAAARRAADAV